MKYQIMLEILFQLLAKKKVTTRELADKYGLSMRTIMRYVQSIELAGIPIYSERGRYGGFYISSDYMLRSTLLTKEELSLLNDLLTVFSSQLAKEQVEQIKNKLFSLEKGDVAQNLFKGERFIIDNEGLGKGKLKERMELINDAITKQLVISVKYLDTSGKTFSSKINPHALLLKDNFWHLIAYCPTAKNFVIIRCSRIKFVEVLKQSFERVPFDGKEIAKLSGNTDSEKKKIIIRIQKNALMEIEDWLGSESIFVKDERYYAKAFLQCDDNLLSKLFSLGNQVTVIKPDELKTKLVKHAKKVIMNYYKHAISDN